MDNSNWDSGRKGYRINPIFAAQLQGLLKTTLMLLVRLSWKTLIQLITKLYPIHISLVALYTILYMNFLSLVRRLDPELPKNRPMRFGENESRKFKVIREGKRRLCVVVTGDKPCFFINNLVASRIMLHGLVRVKMRNQWFALANLR